MTSLRLPAAALTLVALTACEPATDCRPTRVVARNADKVDVRATSRSAIIEARLVDDTGSALGGRTLEFEVLDDGAAVHDADGRTASNGTARVDLKRADPQTLVALARADAFRASFGGDSTYCASVSSDARFGTVRT